MLHRAADYSIHCLLSGLVFATLAPQHRNMPGAPERDLKTEVFSREKAKLGGSVMLFHGKWHYKLVMEK